jgi:hypothetical protein
MEALTSCERSANLHEITSRHFLYDSNFRSYDLRRNLKSQICEYDTGEYLGLKERRLEDVDSCVMRSFTLHSYLSSYRHSASLIKLNIRRWEDHVIWMGEMRIWPECGKVSIITTTEELLKRFLGNAYRNRFSLTAAKVNFVLTTTEGTLSWQQRNQLFDSMSSIRYAKKITRDYWRWESRRQNTAENRRQT